MSHHQQSSFEIIQLDPLRDQESPYLKPFRLLYKQNGKVLTWDCIKTHDSVAILIYNISRNVLVFVRQFRPPVYLSTLFNTFHSSISIEDLKEKAKGLNIDCGYTIELCAGIIDKDGLSPREIAREEVIEETGYNAPLESLQLITTFRTGVGTSGSLQHLFYCQVDDSMRINSGGGIDDESIEVIEFTIEESIKQMYVNDEATGIGRTGGFLFAICWFNYVKLPEIKSCT